MENNPERLVEKISRQGGAALLIGAEDSGKSTLARYLIAGLLKKRHAACLVDTDVGQSSLGLPGTISMKAFRRMNDLKSGPDSIFFVGGLNPANNIPLMIKGARAMAGECSRRGIKRIIVDTTGLVSGKAGLALKLGKIRAIKPACIVAIQRSDELEGLLAKIKTGEVVRFARPAAARARNRGQRIEYRRKKFEEYFKEAGILELPAGKMEFYFKGGKTHLEEKGIFTDGLLLGLNRGEKTIAVGIYMGGTEKTLLVRTPLKSMRGIDRIVLGEVPVRI